MSRSFDVPEACAEEQAKLLNLLAFPPVGEWVESPNIYGDVPLKAMLIEDSGNAYHARPELSHSQFVKFVDEPEVFAAAFLGKPDPDAPDAEHLAFGKQVEHFLFHDEVPGNPIVIPNSKLSRRKRPEKWFEDNQVEYDPANDDHHSFAKAGKDYTAFAAANAGRTVMTEKEFAELVVPLERIRANVRDHSKAKALLYGNSLRHVAIVFTCPFTGILLRCQLDSLSLQRVIVDYKTAARNDHWNFAADFYKWKYHFQATWYREAVRQLSGGDVWPVVYIVTEKQSKAFVVECFNVVDEWFEIALHEWQAELVHFRNCIESQTWKRRSHNTVVDLNPPVYVSRQYKLKT